MLELRPDEEDDVVNQAATALFEMEVNPDMSEDQFLNQEKVVPLVETLRSFAKRICGSVILVDWPFMRQARVSHVVTTLFEFYGDGSVKSNNASKKWAHELNVQKMMWRTSRGVSIPDGCQHIALHVNHVKCLTRSENGDVVRQFETALKIVPSVLRVSHDRIHHHRFEERKTELNEIEVDFPHGSSVLSISDDILFGSVGTVLSYKSDTIASVLFTIVPEDDAVFARKNLESNRTKIFFPHWEAAQQVNISTKVLSRITSSVTAKPGNIEIGLGLNFKKRGHLVSGMVRYSFDEKTGYDKWEYSQDAVDLIQEYKQKFPLVFELLDLDNESRFTDFTEHFQLKKHESGEQFNPKRAAEVYVDSIASWWQKHPASQLPLVSTSSIVAPKNVIAALEKLVNSRKSSLQVETKAVDIDTKFLYKPVQSVQWSPSNISGFSLGDRICYLGGVAGVPFGMRGIVIGIHPLSNQDDGDQEDAKDSDISVKLDVLFDDPIISGTSLDTRCSESRGLTINAESVLNLSEKLFAKSAKQSGVSRSGVRKSPSKSRGQAHQPPTQAPHQAPAPAPRQIMRPLTPKGIEEGKLEVNANSPPKETGFDSASVNASSSDKDMVSFWNSLMNKTTHTGLHVAAPVFVPASAPAFAPIPQVPVGYPAQPTVPPPIPAQVPVASPVPPAIARAGRRQGNSAEESTVPPHLFAYMATASTPAQSRSAAAESKTSQAPTDPPNERKNSRQPKPPAADKPVKPSSIWRKVE
eukprot:TRINITY_DN12246_c0_g1_i1.p1 TRINITY_DN12246_c0_g1~~TRINITY_DN12246_c0_g1_i1.p1  ORF type:complete len:753 (-),score=176.10 TRINITY_DN12246_c0_g1_i1:1055-3313(-)